MVIIGFLYHDRNPGTRLFSLMPLVGGGVYVEDIRTSFHVPAIQMPLNPHKKGFLKAGAFGIFWSKAGYFGEHPYLAL